MFLKALDSLELYVTDLYYEGRLQDLGNFRSCEVG